VTKIKPFRAVIYNQGKIQDLSSVVCPPYDIISPAKQEYYHKLHSYNLIHILLGKDIPGDDKYRRAGRYFSDWLKNRILIQDERPSVYLYSQQYNLKGEKKTRLGLIALLHLENGNSSVFPHEHTRLEPKEDRLKLLREVRANLSPIFVLFSDRKRIIQRINQEYLPKEKPFIDIIDDEKIVHKLWRIDSPDILDNIESQMSQENIFIADGHHRYEVACTYREEMKQKLRFITGEEGFNYILAYFTNVESRGLTILPIHRLVKLDLKQDIQSFKNNLKDYFDVEEIKDKNRFFFLKEKAGNAEHVLGMYKDRRYWLIRLKNVKILDKAVPDKPPGYSSLDVSILNYIILKRILGFDLEDKERITFVQDADELIERVDEDNSYIAFFLNPVKIKQIMAVALSKERMPAKSTYFYPKVLSGLAINKFD
jgi:uncharacterized protein (DUF1015 family)